MSAAREYLKIFIIVPFVLLFNLGNLLSPSQEGVPVSTLLQYKIYATTTQEDITQFVPTIGNLYFIFLFNLLYGIFIFNDFRNCGVYIFPRLKSRSTWFRRKVLTLYKIAILYTLLILGMFILLCQRESGSEIDADVIPTAIFLLYMLSMMAIITTTIINLLAFRVGSIIAFLIVYFVETILILSAILPDDNIPVKILNFINPFEGVIGTFEFGTKAISSMFYIAILLMLVVFLGGRYIEKMDVGLSDAETA